MRIRVTGAAVLGALSLSVLAVPAAQADEQQSLTSWPSAHGSAAGKAADFAATADDRLGDTRITSVTVNGGKDIVVGITKKKSFTVTVTANDPSGIYDGYAQLWHGAKSSSADQVLAPDADMGTCKATSATAATCKVTIVADPLTNIYGNLLAGTWKVWAGAMGNDGDYVVKDAYKTARVQRASKLTVNAAPEPVKKGKTITVTGKLSRANWDDLKYHGYTGQPVKLQYRKKTSKTYTTVKTVKTDSTGSLKTTVKASADGYFRYSFAGTTTTPAVTSTADFVDVK